MSDKVDSIITSFRVLPFCRSLESLEDDTLLDLVSNSIDTFSAVLHDFDLTLPEYLHAGDCGSPKWISMTCATVHIAQAISHFNMDDDEVLSFLKHIHLLYRFDDYFETIPSRYSIDRLTTISEIILNAFAQWESTSDFTTTDPVSASTGSSASVPDSGYEDSEDGKLAGSSFLKHDMLDLIRLLHQPVVQAASQYNQRWYSSELRQLLLAMVQQLLDNSTFEGSCPDFEKTQSGDANLRMWLHSTGATSVGTNYQFAFLACLVSARDQSPCFEGTEQRYLAKTFAQHVSTSWRIWNDIGGRARDEEEGAFTSCSFTAKNDMQSLVRLAEFEVECAILAQKRLAELANTRRDRTSDEAGIWKCLEFFRRAVQLSGEIYMAGDPTRS